MSSLSEKPKLETQVSTTCVTRNKNLTAYLDAFCFQPQNVSEKSRGSLAGFFRVRSDDENLAYVANYLTGVFKKEYYLSASFDAEKSFENALNKLNAALAELSAEAGVDWRQILDAAVCAFTPDTVYLSVCGRAKVDLFRAGQLLNLSENSVSDDPLTVFGEVVSGPLREGDVFVIASRELAEIFDPEEYRRAFHRYTGRHLEQLFHTALVNKSDGSCVHLINIKPTRSGIVKREAAIDLENEDVPLPENVFSAAVFAEKEKKSPSTEKKKQSSPDRFAERSGHIYVRGEEQDTQKTPFAEVFAEYTAGLRNAARTWLRNRREGLSLSLARLLQFGRLLGRKLETTGKKAVRSVKRKRAQIPAVKNKILRPTAENGLREKISPARLWRSLKDRRPQISRSHTLLTGIFSFLKQILPDFRRLREAAQGLSARGKLAATALLLTIIIVPLFFLPGKNPAEPTPAASDANEQVSDSTAETAPVKDEQAVAVKRAHTVHTDAGIKQILTMNNVLFAVTDKTITRLNNAADKEIYNFPVSEYGHIKLGAAMERLNLLFFLTDRNEVISFSPKTETFVKNKITLPAGLKADFLAVYETYLYFFDSEADAIYRYPRATGGFGAGRSWLKKGLKLDKVLDAAIDGSIYVVEEGGKLRAFFKNVEKPLALPELSPALSASAVFTRNDENAPLYVLDAANGRVVSFDKKTGRVLGDFANDEFKRGREFSVNERTRTITVLLENDVVATYRF